MVWETLDDDIEAVPHKRLNTSALVSYAEEDRGMSHELWLRITYCDIDKMISVLQEAKKLLGTEVRGHADVHVDVGSRERYDELRLRASKEYGWC